MACPFARFTRSVGTYSDSDDDDDSTHSPTTKTKLTQLLKDGTWDIHREIEKSPGVRALMGNFHAGSSLQLDRLSHLRFLIMLASIYIAMEARLFQEKTILSDMMMILTRSMKLLEDIQIHLDEILDTSGAEVEQLDATIEEDARFHHEMIITRIQIAQRSLIDLHVLKNSNLLTLGHIALLDKRQALATLNYVEELSSLQRQNSKHRDEAISFTPLETPSYSRSTSSTILTRNASHFISVDSNSDSHLILSHAYVRYMGDLSGGQHIVKRLCKLFPIFHLDELDLDSNSSRRRAGFSFYYFDSDTNKSSTELKSMIRARLDSTILSKEAIDAMIDEACLAFRLNGKILDSLVDEDSSTIDLMGGQQSFNHFTWSMAYTLFQHPTYLLHLISPAVYHPHNLATIAAIIVMISAIYMYNMNE